MLLTTCDISTTAARDDTVFTSVTFVDSVTVCDLAVRGAKVTSVAVSQLMLLDCKLQSSSLAVCHSWLLLTRCSSMKSIQRGNAMCPTHL